MKLVQIQASCQLSIVCTIHFQTPSMLATRSMLVLHACISNTSRKATNHRMHFNHSQSYSGSDTGKPTKNKRCTAKIVTQMLRPGCWPMSAESLNRRFMAVVKKPEVPQHPYLSNYVPTGLARRIRYHAVAWEDLERCSSQPFQRLGILCPECS